MINIKLKFVCGDLTRCLEKLREIISFLLYNGNDNIIENKN